MRNQKHFFRKKIFFVMLLLCSLIISLIWIFSKHGIKRSQFDLENQLDVQPIKIAVICCGQEVVEQLLVMIKSAIIFTNSYLHFIIISNVKEIIIKTITQWPKIYQDKFTYEFITPSFPNVSNPQNWYKEYKPCATEKLFMHLLLPNHDAVIYLDIDIVFLSPPEEIWSLFKQMNSIQIAGYAEDSYDPIHAGYSNDTQFPFASKFGLNSGVVTMNLTRMRKIGYLDSIQTIVDKWGDKIKLFDQDIINIYLYEHPERYLLLPCRFNYHVSHCLTKMNWCESAQKESINVLHGWGKTFRAKSWLSTYKLVYQAFVNYQLGTDLDQNLLTPLKNELKQLADYDKFCSSIIIKSLN